MSEQFITAKMTPDVLRMLRLVAAQTGEKQYAVLRRLLEAEMRRVGLDTVVGSISAEK